MKKLGLFIGATICVLTLQSLNGATNEISGALQRGLFEEEANHNYQAALQSYQAAIESYDESRKMAATALFRLGEINRKLGKTNDALILYQRLVRDFSDQPDLVAAAQKFVGATEAIRFSDAEAARTNAPAVDYDAEEIKRLQKLIAETPDLVNAGAPGNGSTPLHTAVRSCRLAVVQFLLTNNVNVNAQDVNGKTPLARAVETAGKVNSSLDIMAALLKAHADPDLADRWGQTPLHVAAYIASKPAMDILLAANANLNRQAIDGGTPLHYAVAKGFRVGVEALLKKGADPNLNALGNRTVEIINVTEVVIKTDGTPLHLATSLGYSATAEALVAGGADVNATTPSRNTPLHYAVSFRQPAIAKLLLENKANVNAQSEDGTTPLSLAATKSNLEMVKMLLNNHADPKIGDKARATPLHRILQTSQSPEFTNIVSALLDAGSDPNGADSSGHTPLLSVRYEGPTSPKELAGINLLLDRGANVDALDANDGITALIAAVRFANLPMVKLLLAHHANPNLKNSNGMTALHFLCYERGSYQDAPEIARALIAAGAEVNAIEAGGKTPLSLLLLRNSSQASNPSFAPRPARAIPRAGNAIRSTEFAPEVKPLWDVLVQNGAVERMPDFTKVQTARGELKGSGELSKDAKGLNHFTLYELIGQHYFSLFPEIGQIVTLRQADTDGLFFPDFTGVKILRPSRSDPKTPQEITAYIVTAQDTFDCARDVTLEFGDRVDIPEKSHALSRVDNGPSTSQIKSLKDCLQRTITIIVGGQPQDIKLSGSLKDTYLSAALRLPEIQALLRNTSDLSAVKVMRTDPKTNDHQEITEDVLTFWNQQKPFTDDLWLRQGDKIEVSEKH